MASNLHRGYSVPELHFTPVFAVPALAHLKLGFNPVVAFRAAYILTRPPGASFSDWGAVLPAHSGLGIGPGPVSLALGSLIVVAIGTAWAGSACVLARAGRARVVTA